jgi:hypothetical protein
MLTGYVERREGNGKLRNAGKSISICYSTV